MSQREERAARAGIPSNPVAVATYERKRAESRRLQVQALELRKAGYTYRQIGEVQGCAATTVANRVRKAIRREVPQELIDSTRAIELERIDTMTLMCQKIMQKAFDAGDTETYFKAQDRANALHDRRANLIPIKAPTKLLIDQNVTTQTDADRELSEIIGKKADEIKAQVESLDHINNQAFG